MNSTELKGLTTIISDDDDGDDDDDDDDDDDGDDDELFFVVWLTDKRRLALFPTGAIVRDPHHRESPTHREQDLNLHRA